MNAHSIRRALVSWLERLFYWGVIGATGAALYGVLSAAQQESQAERTRPPGWPPYS